MISIRLASVLTLYAVVVCCGFVGLTVMFSVTSDKIVAKSISSLAGSMMNRNLRTIDLTITNIENGVKRTAVVLRRLNATREDSELETIDVVELTTLWSVISAASRIERTIVNTFEMWRNPGEPRWSYSGCSQAAALCTFYKENTNTTYNIPFNSSMAPLAFNNDTMEVVRGPPAAAVRASAFLKTIGNVPEDGVWSPLYVDYSTNTDPMRVCQGRGVDNTLTFYFCLQRNAAGVCTHVTAQTVLSLYIGVYDKAATTSVSKLYFYSVRSQDNVNGVCLPDTMSYNLITNFLNSCGGVDNGAPVQACVDKGIVIEESRGYVETAAAVISEGLFVVVADLTPKSFFDSLQNKSRTASIIVSIVIILFVVAAGAFTSVAITLPIARINRGLRKVSRLEEHREGREPFMVRHTFVSEVRQLYRSYIDLRDALTELKAFVPQGLFVSSAPAASASDFINIFSEGDAVPEKAFESSMEREASTDPQSPTAAGAGHGGRRASMSWGRRKADGTGVVVAPDVEKPESGSAAAQIVPLLSISDDTDNYDNMAAVEMMPRSDSAAAAASLAITGERGPQQVSVLRTLHLVIPGGAGVGSNSFRALTCSFVFISFSFRYLNAESLNDSVNDIMRVVVRVVLRCGGVIEIFRPDILAASFGAHNTMRQHTQAAAACGALLLKRLPTKYRTRTRVVVDSGTFFVGTCGAYQRYSRIVFGDRFDFCLDLLRHDLAFGRVIVTDGIAFGLPKSASVPVDYIIPIRTQDRSRGRGVQLFHLLDPSRRLEAGYMEGAQAFRRAYLFAVSGDYKRALDSINRGGLYDAELGANFAGALRYLLSSTPTRPRYCRFQLPYFELLGSSVKDNSAKYQFENIQLQDVENQESAAVSISFGFGGSSTGTEQMDPNVSAAVFQMEHLNSVSADRDDRYHSSPATVRGSSAANAASPAASNANAAGTSALTSSELPLVITDRNGGSWHRYPEPTGTGAFAQVYAAISSTGAIMALKCVNLSASRVKLEDVVEEVNTACKLFNENIVKYISWVRTGVFLVLFMDYMPGGTLKRALSAFPGGMTLQVARKYAHDTLKGLAYLHRNGIVHADLKPQNILIAMDGTCKISDFGSSLTKARAASYAGDVFNLRGTPLYMSPEVAGGEAPSVHSDMWSFGITLHEVITGALPWVIQETVRVSGPNHPMPKTPKGGLVSTGAFEDSTVTIGDVPADSNKSALTLSSGSSAEVVQYTPLAGVSDVRLVQGIARGTIVARVLRESLPSQETYDLIMACLEVDPAKRPLPLVLLEHPFFL